MQDESMDGGMDPEANGGVDGATGGGNNGQSEANKKARDKNGEKNGEKNSEKNGEKNGEKNATGPGASGSESGALRARKAREARGDAAPATPRVRAKCTTPLFQVHTLKHFLSYSRIPQIMENCVLDALSTNRRLDHMLIHGAPGCGSTLLARALIRDHAARRVVEIDALHGCEVAALCDAVERVADGGVLFIRHIELLDGACERFLMEVLGHMGNPTMNRIEPPKRPRERTGPGSAFDDAIAESARPIERPRAENAKRKEPKDPTDPKAPKVGASGFTLIGTAHITARIGYEMRTRFEHMFHLRDDPKGQRMATVRALRARNIRVDPSTLGILAKILGSLHDCAEQLVRAVMARAELDQIDSIDLETMFSIVTEDLPDRLPNEYYASALRRHLGMRRVDEITEAEVTRVSIETSWGDMATRTAFLTMIREDRVKSVAM